MIYLRYQDTDWVGGNDREVLDTISLRDSLTLATLSIKKNVVIFVFLVRA